MCLRQKLRSPSCLWPLQRGASCWRYFDGIRSTPGMKTKEGEGCKSGEDKQTVQSFLLKLIKITLMYNVGESVNPQAEP